MTPAEIIALRHTITLANKHPLHRTTQKEFAELLNIPAATIRAWEQGKREPSGAAVTLLNLLASDTQKVIGLMQKTG